MKADAIQKIIDLKHPEKIEVGEFDYILPEYVRHQPPTANRLMVHTLQGIVDFLSAHKDQVDGPIIHVVSHNQVDVFSGLDSKFRNRESYCTASLIGDTFPFGSFMSQDKFVIAARSLFVQDQNIESVIEKIGTIVQDSSVDVVDDGISQRVTARKGVAGKENVVLPSRVTLRPFRTFREIDQPESEFVLRINEGPVISLFEADGGTWELDAIAGISLWLREETSGMYPVIS